jgi:hypothetical protein
LRLEKGDDPLVMCRDYPVQGCCVLLQQLAILVGEDASKFRLPGIGCFGDKSRMCCNVTAKGQMVVATGPMRLELSGWVFQREVKLCTLQPGSATR